MLYLLLLSLLILLTIDGGFLVSFSGSVLEMVNTILDKYQTEICTRDFTPIRKFGNMNEFVVGLWDDEKESGSFLLLLATSHSNQWNLLFSVTINVIENAIWNECQIKVDS